jgi:hypothetical protein
MIKMISIRGGFFRRAGDRFLIGRKSLIIGGRNMPVGVGICCRHGSAAPERCSYCIAQPADVRAMVSAFT